ncbi:MAG: M18 family aminopeptidase [Erysipelotrichaceae bacterium]|nr:M18 family aminopeptidase [Erysipelotrichaceae bacterium]MDD3809997.1 M18 family aminopeptidase [Erysipelotrichaceae bacterium]
MNTDLFKFIDGSPSPFHAVEQVKTKLKKNGFVELHESGIWNLEHEKKYFVTRNGTSLIAFTTPVSFDSLKITAAHSDSPTFVIKENGLINDKSINRLNVEKYGGMIMSSFFDRPLSLAGRVMSAKDGKITSQLVNIDSDLLLIPNCAIHLNKDVNDGYKYKTQDDMFPVIGQSLKKLNLSDILKRQTAIADEILGYDLYLYNRQKAGYWGMEKDFLYGPRIDNLESVYGIFEAFTKVQSKTSLNMAITFDNEEVGSSTKQGADSTFLIDTLSRIKEKFGLTNEHYHRMIARGMMVSCDNAHGYHPNYQSLYDQNAPKLNFGVVIKHNSNQKYTTDSYSSAIFKSLLKMVDVPYQDYYNHSNQQGGSTLGNISNTQLSLNTVDIGLAQWAMHSALESAGAKDLKYLVLGLVAFYRYDLDIQGGTINIAKGV